MFVNSNVTDPTFPLIKPTQMPISSNADDRATHELYMWGLAEAVRAGIGYVMCSYNSINGTHACSNAKANNGLLKTELNFQGSIISDWGSVWETEDILGGLDVFYPGAQWPIL